MADPGSRFLRQRSVAVSKGSTRPSESLRLVAPHCVRSQVTGNAAVKGTRPGRRAETLSESTLQPAALRPTA